MSMVFPEHDLHTGEWEDGKFVKGVMKYGFNPRISGDVYDGEWETVTKNHS